jgi:hypothetical protein
MWFTLFVYNNSPIVNIAYTIFVRYKAVDAGPAGPALAGPIIWPKMSKKQKQNKKPHR